MVLTWAGFEVAVDLIAAQCLRRDRSGIYAASEAGLVLAVALADRLSLSLLQLPTPGMVLIDTVATDNSNFAHLAASTEDVEPWAWVDATAQHQVNSALKVQGACARVVMPWQEVPATCRQPFVKGFHD
jgi:hypothetical protein